MQKLYTLPFSLLFLFLFTAAGYSQNNPIVFSSDRTGNFEIYTMEPDGSNLKKITDHPGWDIQPAWTPDGEKIVFSSTRDGDSEIFSMNANGTGLVQLTNNTSIDKAPAVSPDGKFIAFYNSDWEGYSQLHLMGIDGTGLHPIPNTKEGRYPSWSPDSKFLVYAGFTEGTHNGDIFKCGVDGSNKVNLTNAPSHGDYYPSLSPNGANVAFLSFRNGSWKFYLMSSDGKNVKPLTTSIIPPGEYSQAAWSPDSRSILFPQSHDIYSIHLDGSGLTNLTRTAGVDSHPDWLRKRKENVWSHLLPPIVANRAILSSTQRVFVQSAGYPQQFTKSFDAQGGNNRVIETWVYISLGVMESFIDGKFISEKPLAGPKQSSTPGELHPEDYLPRDTPQAIIARHGAPLSIEQGQTWLGATVLYRYNNVTFCFVNNTLRTVVFSSNQL